MRDFFIFGMTSSDVMDTALAIQLKEAAAILIEDVQSLMKVLRRQAYRYKSTVMIGRTHGVHAGTNHVRFEVCALVSRDGSVILFGWRKAVEDI